VLENMTLTRFFLKKGFSKGCGPFACESPAVSPASMSTSRERTHPFQEKETIKKYMDETQTTDETRWFDSEILDDGDFPSGKTIGTEVVNDKCVFLNKSGMCSLQIAGTKKSSDDGR